MIIAVDFDDTLFEYVLPPVGEQDYSGRIGSIGRPIWYWIDFCKRRAHQGDQLILWTCREGVALQQAIDAAASCGLLFDAINTNIRRGDEHLYWPDCRKVKADLYIDDKALRAGHAGDARLIEDTQCHGAFKYYTLPMWVQGPAKHYILDTEKYHA